MGIIVIRIYGDQIEDYLAQGWRVSLLRPIASYLNEKVAYLAWRKEE